MLQPPSPPPAGRMAQRERKKEDFYLLLWREFQNMPLGDKRQVQENTCPTCCVKKGVTNTCL